MLVLNYPPKQGLGFIPNRDVINLFNLIKENFRSFEFYTSKKNIRIANDSTAMVLVEFLSNYFETTPEETYKSVSLRTGTISRLFNFVNIANPITPVDLGFGSSIISYMNHGELNDELPVVRCYHHTGTSLTPDYYINSDELSILTIDIPLLAYKLHKYTNDIDNFISITAFVNEAILIPTVKDFLDLAYLNKTVSVLDTVESNRFLPYYQVNTNKGFLKAKSDIENMHRNFRGNITDLMNNLPLPFAKGLTLPDLDIEYSDKLMLFNMLIECSVINLGWYINDDLELGTIPKQLKIYLPKSTNDTLIKALPKSFREVYTEILIKPRG